MREEGLYWIKLKGKWVVGERGFCDDDEKAAGYWYAIGSDWWYGDEELDEIGDRIVTPDKYKESQ